MRAFQVNISSVKCLIVRFGAKYTSESGGGGLEREIFSAKDVDGLLTRTYRERSSDQKAVPSGA